MASLPAQLVVRPIKPFPPEGDAPMVVRIPGSKSLTNRSLLIAALAKGESTITNVLFADDTRRMLEALQTLGVRLDIDEPAETVTVHGCGGAFPPPQTSDNPDQPLNLFLGNAGTAIRPLTAACCLGQGAFTLDGVPRMRQRPIRELVDPLRELGAFIRYGMDHGYPPLHITANGLRGGAITMRPTQSSQFITALLIAAPLMQRGLTIDFDGPITSQSYVAMTAQLMAHFGVRPTIHEGWRRVEVEPALYAGRAYAVEPDASNASYFLAAAAALPGSRVRVPDLGQNSKQGDAGFINVLQAMGAVVSKTNDATTVAAPPAGRRLRGVNVDLNSMPDAAMTLATLAVLAEGRTTIRNVGNWRVKETDRMTAMKTELEKLGAAVKITGDDITITPPPGGKITAAAIDTYDDHRMAMSFAILGLAQEGVTINDPACVNKTFPTFWQTLNQLGDAVDLPGFSLKRERGRSGSLPGVEHTA